MVTWVLHVAFKRTPYIPGNINGLYFQCTKINHVSSIIVSNQYNVNVTGGTSMLVLKTDFC